MQLANTSLGVGLPDDGFFRATGALPAFQLHFSNAAPRAGYLSHPRVICVICAEHEGRVLDPSNTMLTADQCVSAQTSAP